MNKTDEMLNMINKASAIIANLKSLSDLTDEDRAIIEQATQLVQEDCDRLEKKAGF